MLANPSLNKVNLANKRAWYYWAGLFSIVSSTALFILMIAMGHTQAFIFSKWYQFLIPIPSFFNGHLSGWTSIGREVDRMTDKRRKWTSEQWASIIGIALGITIGVCVVVARSTIHLATAGISDILLETLNDAAAIIGSIGCFCGLTSRLESAVIKPRMQEHGCISAWFKHLNSLINKKRKSVVAGLTLGLATSLTLWFTGTAALTVVVGVTTFFTGGAAIPLWIAGGIFCLSYTAVNASSFDHINKMQTYYQATFLKDKQSHEMIKGKYHEYRGSAIGVTAGFIVASAMVITLLVTQPYLAALISGLAVTLVCTNTFGSLCSYLGSLVDIAQEKFKITHTKINNATSSCHIPNSTTKVTKILCSQKMVRQNVVGNRSYGELKPDFHVDLTQPNTELCSAQDELIQECRVDKSAARTPAIVFKC